MQATQYSYAPQPAVAPGGYATAPVVQPAAAPYPSYPPAAAPQTQQYAYAGQPAPVMGAPMAAPQPPQLALPADRPQFLGATVGHAPMPFTCAKCGYSGQTDVEQTCGAAGLLFVMMTFGLGACCAPKDTHHHCPQCGNYVAYAKLM